MKRHKFNVTLVLCTVFGTLQALSTAYAGIHNCGTTSSGLELCVRFDNLEGRPALGDDFTRDLTTDPDNPTVTLLLGDDGEGTTYQWRVWCEDASDDPANIGSISGSGAEDYDVKVLDANGDEGAATVGGINLDPDGDSCYSSLTGGWITGDLTGDLFLQESTGGQGGTAPFTIGGNVLADMTIPHAAGFTIEGDVGVVPGQSYYNVGIGDILGGDFTIKQRLYDGRIIVDGDVIDGNLQIGQTVSWSSSITIHGSVDNFELRIGYDLRERLSSSGWITIDSHLPANSTIDMSNVYFDGLGHLDLGAHDVIGDVLFGGYNGDTVANSLLGTIEVKESFSGSIDLAGYMSGTILVNTEERNHRFYGVLDIEGDMIGYALIKVFDSTVPGHEGEFGDLSISGRIRVHGDSGIGVSVEIIVEGSVLGAIPTFADLSVEPRWRGRQGGFDPQGLHYKVTLVSPAA